MQLWALPIQSNQPNASGSRGKVFEHIQAMYYLFFSQELLLFLSKRLDTVFNKP